MKLLATSLFTALFCTQVGASLPTNLNLESESKRQESRALGLNGLYQFPKFSEVVPHAFVVDGELDVNVGRVSVDLAQEEVVAVEFLKNNTVLMTLRLAESEFGKVPRQLVLTMEEFQFHHLTMVSFGDAKDLYQNYSGYVETQEASRRKGRARARKHSLRQEFRRGRNGIVGRNGNCVAVVKYYTGFKGVAGNGTGMADALLRVGYRLINPRQVTRGAVCSWSGGSHGLGHVAYFNGRCFEPIYNGNCGQPGKRFRLKKCVIR